jgi:hypothetical protein
MSAFSKTFFGAVIVLGTVVTASAASMRTFYDDSGAWHIQDQSGVWPEHPGSVTAAPPIFVLPTRVQEPLTLREQERLDLVQGHIG